LASLNMWFKSNKLTMDFGKTHFTQFTSKNSHDRSTCQLCYQINFQSLRYKICVGYVWTENSH
jgi:hypothetical protein